MDKKLILLDLDGVLNTYNGHFDENHIPDIKKGCRNFLKAVSQAYEIRILTSRKPLLVAKWLIKNKIDSYVTDITNIKIPAFLYIDDRCICFDGSFKTLMHNIEKFDVHWKE